MGALPAAEEPLQGTIITNRSDRNARFFVEGMTYDLAPERSVGISLPRASSVLNLFNCDATLPESQEGCFWDPYLVTQDGFFEIYSAPDAASAARLLLREAGSPPTDQVWVQNRTSQTEQVVYKDTVIDLPPATVREFEVATGVPAILYVRSCLTLDGQSVCEWAPKTLGAGVYYAMVAVETPGAQAGSMVTTIDLRPVMADGEVSAAEAAVAPVAPAPGAVVCRLAVPALNVRSGPGLQYDIIGKIRTTGPEAATVTVTGRSADAEWLTVTPDVADDGWITSSSSFITCDGDVNGLPLVEAPPPPTPEPAVQAPEPQAVPAPAEQPPATPSPVEPAPAQAAPAEPAAGETVSGTAPAIPPGQALLVVNNGFQYDMRFTVDQMYRPIQGPSEYDLAPGESVSIVVHPGRVAFTASSPWNGLSGNAELTVDADQSVTLWLRFELDGDGSGEWSLAWQ
jgi:hypothetical protein